MSQLSSDAQILALTRDLSNANPEDAISKIEGLLDKFPDDPRLLFLYGSNLTAAARLIEAHRFLSRAVELAPDFNIARFQLGLFQLTSGEPEKALATWEPLEQLTDSHYLRLFSGALRRLIEDDFSGAIEGLRRGISVNDENLPLNRDMQRLIDECALLTGRQSEDQTDIVHTETSLILRRFSDSSDEN